MKGSFRSPLWIVGLSLFAVVGTAAYFTARAKHRADAIDRAVFVGKGEPDPKEPQRLPPEPKARKKKPAAVAGNKQGKAENPKDDVTLASAAVDLGQKLPLPPGSKSPPKRTARRRVVTSPEALDVAPGFRVELVRTADLKEGSWICLTKDHLGRLIISGQPGQGMFRATLAGGKVEKWESLEMPVSGAMGALYAYDSLYLTAEGKEGYGLYRCRDTDGDDQYDDFQRLAGFGNVNDQGLREHGPHGLELGPDGKIYCVIGNRTMVIEGLVKTSPHRHHDEDVLPPVPIECFPESHGEHYPGGYVVRFDADGGNRELVLGGLRNAYDLAFNGDGECFTFDNDTEWDWGMPWYRPTRINHCVSGAEFGWRSLNGPWPSYFEDSLPAIGEVGLAAPCGVATGRGAKFPAKYQRALYLMDWTYGRIIAAHLQPDGASYTTTWENFVAPLSSENQLAQPFNVTDMTVGDDGALYFIVGGRNARGCLYRVVYTGDELTIPADLANEDNVKDREIRRQLESFHGHATAGAVEEIWPHLASDDRPLRYAARIAIESQPVQEWQAKAHSETDPLAKLNLLLAQTRVVPAKDQGPIQDAIADFPTDELDREQKLIYLRICAVSLARYQDQATSEFKQKLIAKIEPMVPTTDEIVNREGMRLLIFLEAPSAVAKGLALINDAKTLQDQMFYLLRVKALPARHWNMNQRKSFLKLFGKDRPKLPSEPQLAGWFKEVDREFTEGSSFYEFMTDFFWEYVNDLPEGERAELDPLIQEVNQTIMPQFDTPAGLPIQREWAWSDIEPILDRADHGRVYDRGKRSFINAQCIKCHRFDSAGGSIGPDLTSIARRFTREQIAESIVMPSKVLSDQYAHAVVTTDDGRAIVGRVVQESAELLVIQPNPLAPERVEIPKSTIEDRRTSKVSPMPEHLIDVLNVEEVLDLIAYLESAGSKSYPAFQRQPGGSEE